MIISVHWQFMQVLTGFGAHESRSTSSLPERGVRCVRNGESETDLYSNIQDKDELASNKLGMTLLSAVFVATLVPTGNNALPTLMSFTHGNLCKSTLIKW